MSSSEVKTAQIKQIEQPADIIETENGEQDNQPQTSSSQDRRSPRRGGLSQELRERVKQNYQARAVNLMVRYNKLGSQFADFANNVAFLSRCATMMMVPKTHRVYNQQVRNTRVVVRLLDQCSYKILIADLEHNRRRKYQVRKNRERVEARLKDIMSPEDFEEIQNVCEENKERHFNDVKERQRGEFEELMEEYKSSENRRMASRRSNANGNDRDEGTNGDADGSPGNDNPENIKSTRDISPQRNEDENQPPSKESLQNEPVRANIEKKPTKDTNKGRPEASKAK